MTEFTQLAIEVQNAIANGEVSEHKITPGVEYAFELKSGAGISKMLREHEQQTHIYWLAWECLR